MAGFILAGVHKKHGATQSVSLVFVLSVSDCLFFAALVRKKAATLAGRGSLLLP
jgi:hypothetical protein